MILHDDIILHLGFLPPKIQNGYYTWLTFSFACSGHLWVVSKEDLANCKELKN